MKTARECITEAAEANGWVTDRGYRLHADKSAGWSGQRGTRHLHVEFSSNGGITYAATGSHRIDGTGKLSKVLEYIEGSLWKYRN